MSEEVTHILTALESGDPQAAGRLLPLVYDELRRLAARKLAREEPGQTLDATALVHEAYLRLLGPANADDAEDDPKAPASPPRYNGRAHFYAAAAEAMRRILIDNARRKASVKRGGHRRRVELHDNLAAATASSAPLGDLLAIDEALTRLSAVDPPSAELVKLRFYAGLSVDEAAEVVGLARATAYRTWTYAKAWLRTQLADLAEGDRAE